MGSGPSNPSEECKQRLLVNVDGACVEAARIISEADVFLLCTGAGFSADSGLAIYADVAKVPAYAARRLEYHDICKPNWLSTEPELFWGFWGQCYNDYRSTPPHEGYAILDRWVDQYFRTSPIAKVLRCALEEAKHTSASNNPSGDSNLSEQIVTEGGALAESATAISRLEPYVIADCPGAFFAFTSNVDAHHYDWFRACEIRECHGNTELYQCAGKCKGIWRAPTDFQFYVDKATMLAPKDVGSAETNTGESGSPEVTNVNSVKDAVGGDVDSTDASVPPIVADRPIREENQDTTINFPSSATGGVPVAVDGKYSSPAPPCIGEVRGGGRPEALRYMPPSAIGASGFSNNHPICFSCGGPARPAILMFGDYDWEDLDSQEARWQAWTNEVQRLAQKQSEARQRLRVAILEIGAGGNVTTVRFTSENQAESLRDAGAMVRLIRVNPDLPLADDAAVFPVEEGGADGPADAVAPPMIDIVSIMSKGLEALHRIDAAMAPNTCPRE